MREFREIGSGLWQATDGSEILIGINGASTMVSVEGPGDAVRDFWIGQRPTADAMREAIAYARTL